MWGLVCEKAYLSYMAFTIQIVGLTIGSVCFGYLTDRYGRKWVRNCTNIVQLGTLEYGNTST